MFISLLLYRAGIALYATGIRIAAVFLEKARLFVAGRKHIYALMQRDLAEDLRRRIWVHCASLGEFEQARPVIEALRKRYSDRCIVLTFFSPSGYEVQKEYKQADFVYYLPLDSAGNARHFLDVLQPEIALFVKYEFWYHYLTELNRRQIPVLLFSALFRERQPFFKWYGGLFRRMLACYEQIFVQDETSRRLLEQLGVGQVQIAGDTRFDRSWQVARMDKHFPTLETFKTRHKLIVAGSTWKDDELLLRALLAELPEQYRLLIAPHEVSESHVREIMALFPGKACLWNADAQTLQDKRVAIVAEVGFLSFLYRYADIVWIGGGFTRTGIHNIIEPAVYGKPVFFGPEYSRYREAVDMLEAGAVVSTNDTKHLLSIWQDENALQVLGNSALSYVQEQLGATERILRYLELKCLPSNV